MRRPPSSRVVVAAPSPSFIFIEHSSCYSLHLLFKALPFLLIFYLLFLFLAWLSYISLHQSSRDLQDHVLPCSHEDVRF